MPEALLIPNEAATMAVAFLVVAALIVGLVLDYRRVSRRCSAARHPHISPSTPTTDKVITGRDHPLGALGGVPRERRR